VSDNAGEIGPGPDWSLSGFAVGGRARQVIAVGRATRQLAAGRKEKWSQCWTGLVY